jgi:hypothetical protein
MPLVQSAATLHATHLPLPSQTAPPLSVHFVPTEASWVPQQPAGHVAVTHEVVGAVHEEASVHVMPPLQLDVMVLVVLVLVVLVVELVLVELVVELLLVELVLVVLAVELVLVLLVLVVVPEPPVAGSGESSPINVAQPTAEATTASAATFVPPLLMVITSSPTRRSTVAPRPRAPAVTCAHPPPGALPLQRG